MKLILILQVMIFFAGGMIATDQTIKRAKLEAYIETYMQMPMAYLGEVIV